MRETRQRCVRVVIEMADPISGLGIASQLESGPGVMVSASNQRADADVVVLAPKRLDPQVLADLRLAALEHRRPTVLLTDEVIEADAIRESGLLVAVECGVVAVLPTPLATEERLRACVFAAASGAAMLPPELVGELLRQVERLRREVLEPLGLNSAGLTQREVDVLRLMSEGFENTEIGAKLCYSERTVKNIIHGVTSRFDLRGRPHAVAYAIQAGII